MPLARMAMYAKGVEIYLAPTADSRDTWQATLRHIACEGRCFVLGCNQFVTKAMYPPDLPGIADLAGQPDVMCRGGSAIMSPFGDVIVGPLFDAGRHPLRRAGPGRRRAREVRFRRGRPLRAAGRVPVDGQRTTDAPGEIELVTLSELRPDAVSLSTSEVHMPRATPRTMKISCERGRSPTKQSPPHGWDCLGLRA